MRQREALERTFGRSGRTVSTMMIRRCLALVPVVAVGLALGGCSSRPAGGNPVREPMTSLPASFRPVRAAGIPTAGDRSALATGVASGPVAVTPGGAAAPTGAGPEDSAALIEWSGFFTDRHLLGLIATALADNKELGVMLQRISAARNEIQERRGEYRPFVEVKADAGTERVGEHTRAGAVEDGLTLPGGKAFPTWLGDYRVGLSSRWELDVWHKLRKAEKSALLEFMASEEGRRFLVTNLVAEVARSYYELMALDNQLVNLSQSIALQQDGLRMARQLKANARADTLAVNRYGAEVEKNLARRFAIEQEIVVVENRLNLLLGRTPRPIERASASFMEIEPGTLAAGVPSQLLVNRPDLRRAELELEAAALDVDVARADFLPKFEIKAGVGFEAVSLGHLLRTPASLATSLLGGLVAPLVNKRAIRARYRTATARQLQAVFEYEAAILTAFNEVENQLSNLDNLAGTRRHKQEQVALLTESVAVATQLFKSARIEYLEVLLAQREALEARSELIETRLAQVLAQVDLYKALGGGWREAIPESPSS